MEHDSKVSRRGCCDPHRLGCAVERLIEAAAELCSRRQGRDPAELLGAAAFIAWARSHPGRGARIWWERRVRWMAEALVEANDH